MISKLLNIKYPIFQGAMANISDAKFAASVSKAGGLGIIGTGGMKPDEVREQIRLAKQLTDKPFGVNVMLMNPYSNEIIDIIVEEKVEAVTTGAGNPGPYINKLKDAGIKIFPVVGNVALAKRLARYDIDGLIVEGTESGGHVGETTTMALIPQVCKEVDLPIIAAGGIGNGAGMAAAIALGASGIQVGTCLLVANECPIHDNYKKAIIKAKESDTVVTGRAIGVPVRILKNKMSKKHIELEKTNPSKEELEHLTLGSLRKAVFEGDIEEGSLMSGQIAGLIKHEDSLSNILKNMVDEYNDIAINFNKGIINYEDKK